MVLGLLCVHVLLRFLVWLINQSCPEEFPCRLFMDWNSHVSAHVLFSRPLLVPDEPSRRTCREKHTHNGLSCRSSRCASFSAFSSVVEPGASSSSTSGKPAAPACRSCSSMLTGIKSVLRGRMPCTYP
jgi:hypothetical protein